MKSDVLIIGGGPGGSAMAMFLAQEGIKPVILEQEEFPRYHIGESMTGEAGQLLRRLGLKEEMIKREHPVKHGVRVFGTNVQNSWYVPVTSRDMERTHYFCINNTVYRRDSIRQICMFDT